VSFSVKKLFLIDGIGALISVFMLGLVLVKFESHFGIPSSTLYILALLLVFFAVYDFICFRNNASYRFLNFIAIANLLYCCFSLALVWSHRSTVTSLGWIYVVVEVFVVVVLAVVELRVVVNSGE
jgi:signal transduction histidine kinase